ncbi:SDR family NAD(P)-dependent oxidoreductase [Sediminicola sp. 1XM1-17]|uniref:SDR family NAD(P)-dependent oxidoreductase n=1 Tax=Sediminicola sp. 1XM1-17 TaxID=3127702 RepID=UPI003077377F
MNKIILITGSTDGIGKLTAMKLAGNGHTVYVHGRNKAKLEAVISEIKEASNNQNVKGFLADFSDLDAVSKMAEQVKNEVPAIDVMINNAGVYNSKTPKNKDGLDIRFVVNYLAPYVLTHALLPKLKKAVAPRIINLSSAAQATVDEDVIRGKQQVSDNAAYAQSKLALTMWSFHLAQAEPNIVVIAVNPGSLLNTKMVQEAFGEYWSPTKKGVDILYDLALLNTYSNDSGKYFDNDKGNPKGVFGPAHADASDEGKITTMLDLTENILERIQTSK